MAVWLMHSRQPASTVAAALALVVISVSSEWSTPQMRRPSWPVVVNSILNIGVCLFVGGVYFAGFTHWDPCVWIGSAFLIGPCLGIAWLHYQATFRNHRPSARLLTILLAGGAALATMTACSAVLEPLVKATGLPLWYVLEVVAPMVLIALELVSKPS